MVLDDLPWCDGQSAWYCNGLAWDGGDEHGMVMERRYGDGSA